MGGDDRDEGGEDDGGTIQVDCRGTLDTLILVLLQAIAHSQCAHFLLSQLSFHSLYIILI
jgi:hypothetical protein